jgi:adenylate kinase family enzyme
MTNAAIGQRIVVVGTTGSGKTTLSCQLAQRLYTPQVELDSLFWGPNWTPVSVKVFRQRTAEALSGDAWVADGNYNKVRDIVWQRATTLVWLDYPLSVILGRLIRRTLRRAISQERLWSGNRERLREAFFGRESLLLWALRSHYRHRRQYPSVLGESEYAHLHVIRLRSPQETREWLATIYWAAGDTFMEDTLVALRRSA